MSFLKDILFPKFCLGCSRPGVYICHHCQKKLLYIKTQKCFYCKKTSLYNLTHINCLKKLYIDQVGSIFYYNDFLKKIIKNIKYRYAKEILKELFKIIKVENIGFLELYKNIKDEIFIQPIPLHKSRFNERGFNQAQIITDYLSGFIDYPAVDYLERVKQTKNQAEIKDKYKRFQNVRGAFRLRKNIDLGLIKNKRVILVDDVITTGHTVNEAAKIFKKAGVLKVYCFTLAQG
ncbi:MAG: ComF family protein [Candidatus Microgenomates bacterium]